MSEPAVSQPVGRRGPRIVAAFDFDGTLTTRDCVVPFLDRVAGRLRIATKLIARPVAMTNALVRRDRDGFKALAIRAALAGREAAQVETLGVTFATSVYTSWMRPDTILRLAWHRAEAHRIVLVSASLGAYLRPLGELLRVDGVLCTEAVVGDDGRYTGAMAGANCRGPEKARRLRAWLAEMNLADAQLWAYGDSAGDRELLEMADHRVFVKNVAITPVPATAT